MFPYRIGPVANITSAPSRSGWALSTIASGARTAGAVGGTAADPRAGGGSVASAASAGDRPARSPRGTGARLGGGHDRAALPEVARDRWTGPPLGSVNGLGDRLK